ncbi:phage Gp19/Gp15/Gp42 family protein [Crossiella sp. SN42]|uniref:Gp19/Gp15/Gp42 family protein n=1 Tax=Crossiella sp. SN42 TaxID=2944808 RepID=UPI00207C332F|nr:Gp19/Gp15/Gp42 family protein [Crossiella sp. SN42]MCO1575360.1 phage Gp19/Gp15/Gp42 family protein [Crossiella sp. SN42]
MGEYATVTDVIDRYEQPLTPEQRNRLPALIEDVETALLATVPSLPARITARRTRREAVRLVVITMTLRVLRNPAGYRSEQVGEYSYTLDSAVSGGRLMLGRAERVLLGLHTPARSVPTTDEALPRPVRHPGHRRRGHWFGDHTH